MDSASTVAWRHTPSLVLSHSRTLFAAPKGVSSQSVGYRARQSVPLYRCSLGTGAAVSWSIAIAWLGPKVL